MSTTHITPEHKTLVVALHEGTIAGFKIFDKDAKTHAHVHLASGNISWRSSAARKDVLDRGFVSVKCRVYHFKPRYTVSANINGTRYEAHVDRLGGHFMQVQHKNSQGYTVCSVLWFATKSASKTWQERGYAMIAPQQTEDRGATVNEQADAVLARFAPVAQEPAPVEPITEEPVAQEPVYYSCTSDLRPALKRLGYEQAGGGVCVPKHKQEELVGALRDAARAHKAYTEPAPATHVLSARAQGVHNHEAALASHEIAAQAHKVVARLLTLAQRITEHVYRAAITERLHRPAPVAQEPVTEEPTPVAQEPAPLATVELGESPAGVQWNVYPLPHETRDAFEARVQVARERLAALHAKHAPAAPVTEEPARPRPARHRNALAHLAGLNDVVRDFLVDTYATETEMRWHERDPHTWTERQGPQTMNKLTHDTPALRAAALLAYVATFHADSDSDNDLVTRALKRGDSAAAAEFLATVSVDLTYTAPRATLVSILQLLTLREDAPTVYSVLVEAMDDARLLSYENAEFTLCYDSLEEQDYPLPPHYTWDDVSEAVREAREEAESLVREAEVREAAREAVRAAEVAATHAREALEALCAEDGADA